MPPKAFQPLRESVKDFAWGIGHLRALAGDAQRDTYAVVLGRMVKDHLIEKSVYREIMAIPRRERR